eukprot:gene18000-18237_t
MPTFAADYAPSSQPPTLTPQITRQAPRAAQAGVPEKWIYSKFLDEVEKNNVEKVTFSPDGKKAVGVDDDGDRFTVDIPNDPNLLSFLVQHKVEINVAPINANGGTGADAAAALYPHTSYFSPPSKIWRNRRHVQGPDQGGPVYSEVVDQGPEDEDLVVTTGASGDLQQIFRIARAMVCELGMSRLPPLNYDFQSQGEGDVDWPLSLWLKERINSEILRLVSNGYYTAKQILQENEDLLWDLARRLVQDDQVSQEEFHFMLYEANAKTYPYGLYGDTKVDLMPYQNDPNSVADDLFESIPKFSQLMPTASELTDPDAIAKLPELKRKYEEDEAAALDRMRRPNPLLDDNWGKSKMEIIAEAEKVQREDLRKQQLLKANQICNVLDLATSTVIRYVEMMLAIRILSIQIDYAIDKKSQIWMLWTSDARFTTRFDDLSTSDLGLHPAEAKVVHDRQGRMSWAESEDWLTTKTCACVSSEADQLSSFDFYPISPRSKLSFKEQIELSMKATAEGKDVSHVAKVQEKEEAILAKDKEVRESFTKTMASYYDQVRVCGVCYNIYTCLDWARNILGHGDAYGAGLEGKGAAHPIRSKSTRKRIITSDPLLTSTHSVSTQSSSTSGSAAVDLNAQTLQSLQSLKKSLVDSRDAIKDAAAVVNSRPDVTSPLSRSASVKISRTSLQLKDESKDVDSQAATLLSASIGPSKATWKDRADAPAERVIDPNSAMFEKQDKAVYGNTAKQAVHDYPEAAARVIQGDIKRPCSFNAFFADGGEGVDSSNVRDINGRRKLFKRFFADTELESGTSSFDYESQLRQISNEWFGRY